MLLPIFSPKQDDSNYSFLQTEMLNNINQLIDAVNNGNEYWLYTEEECYFIHEKNSNLREMRSYLLIHKPRKKKFKFTKEQSERLQQTINQKQQWQLWLSKQCVIIQGCLNKGNEQHEPIKRMWQQHFQLATYNHASLCAIAAEILPKLIKHHEYADSWLEWQQVLRKPKQILLNYKKYLVNFQQDVNNLQNQIVESMLLRLIACDESHFMSSNPVIYFTQKLENHGLLCVNETQKESDQLTDKEFNYFHWYIEKHGSNASKKRLLQLSWYKNQQTLPCKILATAEGAILVPEKISNNVPIKRYWPNWLYQSHNLRLTIAQSSTYLVALLSKRRNLSMHFIDLKTPPSYQYLLDDLKSKENYINAASKNISIYQKNYNSFFSVLFNEKTMVYLSDWQKILSNINVIIFEDKLLLCEILLNSVKEKSNDNDGAIILDMQSCRQLELLLSDLEQTAAKNKISISLDKRLQSLTENIYNVISYNKALRIIDDIVNGISAGAESYQFLVNYIESLNEYNSTCQKQLLMICQKNIIQIKHMLYEQLKEDNFSVHGNNMVTKRNFINCCHLIVTRFGDATIRYANEQKIKKYFFKYLQELLLGIFDRSVNYEKQSYLECSTEVLKLIGHSISIAGKTISQHLQELQNVNETSKSLWRIKSYSLLMILADELIEKRFCKEAKLLDDKLFGLLHTHERLRYCASTIKILQKTRDKFIDQQLSCAAFAANLPKAEQVLMGINYPDSAAVQDIIVATTNIYKTQKQIRDGQLEPIHKIEKIKTLNRSINNFLHQHPLVKDNISVNSMSSKPWFNKYYLKEEMLVLAKHSMGI